MARLDYHFEPKKGWMNDPNGLVWFRGRYHAFFQHDPNQATHKQSYWGHAVSDDLIHWEELPIALYPDQPYENSGGCFSGSAIVKDDRLYLFYTSVSHELEQTQSMAYSDDGINFTKHPGNPIIKDAPHNYNENFRDPKVNEINGKYYMVLGTSHDWCGQILLYTSDNLFSWEYSGVLFEKKEYGIMLECPDFFPFEDKYMLMFSKIETPNFSAIFVYGDFDGKTFTPISTFSMEAGPHFYAPQTFLDGKGRRIMIGWLSSWSRPVPDDAVYSGALTIPREIRLVNGKLTNFPVEEATGLLSREDEHVIVNGNSIELFDGNKTVLTHKMDEIREVHILRDTSTIEVFVNGGEMSATFYYEK